MPLKQWPQPAQAPENAPDVVVILLDDIGFGDAGVFGGPASTPELSKLAEQGLRYNNFNTTAMCSPTRAALLTGRNHHRTGFGIIADRARPYEGYDSVWKPGMATIAEVLKENGYSTAAFGKWHNTPYWEITPLGPFDRWPTGLGFEYFYGFNDGQENQWEPSKLYRDTVPVEAWGTPEQGYHFTADMTDEAIRWIRSHQSLSDRKPYFVYFAPGAVHAPHHAPAEWIERYQGKFDRGWDVLNREIFERQKTLGVVPANAVLTPRPDEVPAWESLSVDQRRLYARQMEVYAGFISHTDHEIGRLLDAVRSGPRGDNTLIIYIVGDNGAAGGISLDGYGSEAATLAGKLAQIDEIGGPDVPINIYSSGWAWMGSTPFRYWKTVASHFGGTRNPMIISWPARIRQAGGLRSQFTHVTDIAPTIYDLAGIPLPTRVDGVEQESFDGVSFASTLESASAPARHTRQYFEMYGNRAIYDDGWIASARHQKGMGWAASKDRDPVDDTWELYDLDADFSQAFDLAAKHPEKLAELKALFEREAERNRVLPLIPAADPDVPNLLGGRTHFEFHPAVGRVPNANLPDIGGTSFRLSARIHSSAAVADGVLVSYGDRAAGIVWYVKEGFVTVEMHARGGRDTLVASVPIGAGTHELVFDFVRANDAQAASGVSGFGRLHVDGEIAAEAPFASILQPRDDVMRDVALYIGRAGGSPVSQSYAVPFAFNGSIEKIVLELQ